MTDEERERWREDWRTRPLTYVLHDGVPVPENDPVKLAEFFADAASRIVARTPVTNIHGTQLEVSTVFLVHDHAFSGGPPVLWETMIFHAHGRPGEQYGDFQWRYRSREAAEQGHTRVCEALRRGGSLDSLKHPEGEDDG